MTKRGARRSALTSTAAPAAQAEAGGPRLPKRSLEKIHLGQSFAEYDLVLQNNAVFVSTPSINAAVNHQNPHCFFVGRRGTGKTATTLYLSEKSKNVLVVRPQIFSPNPATLFNLDQLPNDQRSFRSLLAAFRRALQDEVLFDWIARRPTMSTKLPDAAARELELFGEDDFDIRTLRFIAEFTRALHDRDETSWLSELRKVKQMGEVLKSVPLPQGAPYTVVLDAIDDYWDGSEHAVRYLTALMHASLEINSQIPSIRVLIFLRENIFERVRSVDQEFARLETCVIGLDWTREQLIELIERRVNAPLNTKLALGGATWKAFFEDGDRAYRLVLDYCQHRPRDVLTYCSLALDTAQAHKHDQVMIEDLQDARRRFSDSRLKDLSDEYQENYPRIALILSSFYGLGQRLTVGGMEDFVHKILEDPQVNSECGTWIYEYSQVEKFVRLFYDVGFFGLKEVARHDFPVTFRTLGPRDTTPPPISENTEIWIHPTYHQALDLQNVLIDKILPAQPLRREGIVLEIPEAMSEEGYRERLTQTLDDLKTLPRGRDAAGHFEDLVGEVIRLCLFRPLTKVESQSRDVDGTTRKDWVASNRAETGFWEMIQRRYNASQIFFECKNFDSLDSSAFQQCAYYMTEPAGKFVVLVFRGELKSHYYEHIKRVHVDRGGLILLINDKDLQVFLRQSLNGKVKDDHLRDRYDATVRQLA